MSPNMKEKLRIIDLFAGIGGMRLGFEQACAERSISTECVLTSELKPWAIRVLEDNFSHHNIQGDITCIGNEEIPPFDILLAGFPCQPFSAGGKRNGFLDTRGTLFFELERIIRYHRPTGFILENVEGLVKHDRAKSSDPIGRTLSTILYTLETELGYDVSWEVLDSQDFAVPQARKRIYIVGSSKSKVNLRQFPVNRKALCDVLESGQPGIDSQLTRKLFERFAIQDLHGKAIKDKRGGGNNIHSWELGLKGECTDEQISLLNRLFRERRKKLWAKQIGITWMDGMPLTLKQIRSFYQDGQMFAQDNLEELLDDLVHKGYLKFEHPKNLLTRKVNGGVITERVYDTTKEKGYNIVSGKLSYEISAILDPGGVAPTLVATDMMRIAVPDGDVLRRLTIREGLRMFGYPENFIMRLSDAKAYDLLGNTVAVPVVKSVASRLLESLIPG